MSYPAKMLSSDAYNSASFVSCEDFSLRCKSKLSAREENEWLKREIQKSQQITDKLTQDFNRLVQLFDVMSKQNANYGSVPAINNKNSIPTAMNAPQTGKNKTSCSSQRIDSPKNIAAEEAKLRRNKPDALPTNRGRNCSEVPSQLSSPIAGKLYPETKSEISCIRHTQKNDVCINQGFQFTGSPKSENEHSHSGKMRCHQSSEEIKKDDAKKFSAPNKELQRSTDVEVPERAEKTDTISQNIVLHKVNTHEKVFEQTESLESLHEPISTRKIVNKSRMTNSSAVVDQHFCCIKRRPRIRLKREKVHSVIGKDQQRDRMTKNRAKSEKSNASEPEKKEVVTSSRSGSSSDDLFKSFTDHACNEYWKFPLLKDPNKVAPTNEIDPERHYGFDSFGFSCASPLGGSVKNQIICERRL